MRNFCLPALMTGICFNGMDMVRDKYRILQNLAYRLQSLADLNMWEYDFSMYNITILHNFIKH